ncbi:MAG: TlpA disulfide reductase family protein [Mariprofundales bacterium]|nr:TlpA disulfide reductase family protein [Mariprofundales bacterium]
MRVSKQLAITLIAISAWADFAQADSASDFGVQPPHIAKTAPDFTLPNLDGVATSLRSLRGRVVLLHFWATWCAACRHEMPTIDQVWRDHRREGIALLGINVDRGSDDTVRDYLRQLNINFPSLHDTTGSVRSSYAIRALPVTYAINRDGKIIGRIIGERDWSTPAATAWLRSIEQ